LFEMFMGEHGHDEHNIELRRVVKQKGHPEGWPLLLKP
jgi:hypothetical protein